MKSSVAKSLIGAGALVHVAAQAAASPALWRLVNIGAINGLTLLLVAAAVLMFGVAVIRLLLGRAGPRAFATHIATATLAALVLPSILAAAQIPGMMVSAGALAWMSTARRESPG